MALDVPYFKLNSGQRMPSVGLGCRLGPDGGGERAVRMVALALEVGYRHFDTAASYLNEEEVGHAIRSSGVPRGEIFVTTKLPGDKHDNVKGAFEESLQRLGLDYIDMYLMHWPMTTLIEDGIPRVLQPDEHPNFIDVWKEMELLLETGKVKGIGVSNFSIKTLEQLLPHVKITPAVNQVELHPMLPQPELLNYCNENSILLTAYSPFGQDNQLAFQDEFLKGIASAHERCSVAQVIVSWSVMRGTAVLAKSEKAERLKDNATLIELTPLEMEAIEGLHLEPGYKKSLKTRYHKDGKVFGWTLEQLGWDYTAAK